MNAYLAYKDSGISWIGDIPAHWEVQRLKTVAEIIPSNIDKKSVEGEPEVMLCNYLDVYRNDRIHQGIPFMEATASISQIEKLSLRAGDVIVTKDSESPHDIGIPAFVPEDLPGVVCGYHLSLIRPQMQKLNGGFLHRYLNCAEVKYYFATEANGITRFALLTESFADLPVPLPPPAEQKAIAAYLDQKTTQLDRLLEAKRQQIALLKEERTALVNTVVTKGLNPDAPMKDSGITWIGEIPAYWEVKKLKYLGWTQNGISKPADSFGFGFPFVSYGDVYRNSVVPNPTGLVDSTVQEQGTFSVEVGDVFFTRTSETIQEIGFASTCIESIPNATFAGFLIRFRPWEGLLNLGFSRFYFRSQIHRPFFVHTMNLVTRASLSQELLHQLPVLLPPPTEQQEISDYLEKAEKNHLSRINILEQEIQLLQEYRKALISEVVTGKVMVLETYASNLQHAMEVQP